VLARAGGVRIAPLLVTGAGVLSPLGTGAAAILEGAPERKTAVDDRELARLVDPAEARRSDRFSQLALAAAKLASQRANLADAPRERVGLVVGTGLGSLATTESILAGIADKGVSYADPFRFSDSMDSAAAAHGSISLSILGPSVTISHREISGEMAVIRGALLLWAGEVDAVVVAAADSVIDEVTRQYARLGSSRPPGERAGAIVLEREETARARGASPIGKLLGVAQVSGDRPRARVRDADLATLAAACESARAMAGIGDGTVLEPEDHSAALGHCQGDGVVRVAVALERLARGDAQAAWVARGERGGSAAALLVGRA
jgi:3-oxoacyl-[acyl-carrier-protein] synthase II